MKKILMLGMLFMFFMMIAVPAMAALTTFTTGSSGVDFSVYDNGFYVRSDQIAPNASSPGLYASSYISGSNFILSAVPSSTGDTYTDAGIVLYFNGGLTLGNLQSVSISATGTGTPLPLNLWFDTGGDGSFFAFDSNGLMSNLNGDSYAGANGSTNYDATSAFYILGGNGAGGTYTLAQLQAGAVSGIDANTPIALWIGQVGSDAPPFSANISSVGVSTVPLPPSAFLLGSGLLGLFGLGWRRKRG